MGTCLERQRENACMCIGVVPAKGHICICWEPIVHRPRSLQVYLEEENLPLSPTQALPCAGRAPTTHSYAYMHTQNPWLPSWFLPPCRPGSPAHTRTGGGGSPAPGPASQRAGRLHCTSCTRRLHLTRTGRRCQVGESGNTDVGNVCFMYTGSDTLGARRGCPIVFRDHHSRQSFFLYCTNTNP